MKTFAILILFCTSLYGADITTTNVVGDITTKISERLGKDGKPDLRIETVYRGKTMVLRTMTRCKEPGAPPVVSRGYCVDGKLHLIESDEDGDGFFESVAVFDPVTDNFEKFTRLPDGTVQPVSTRSLDAIKRQKAVADDSMKKLLAYPDMTSEELQGLLETNRQKIDALKKAGKKDGD